MENHFTEVVEFPLSGGMKRDVVFHEDPGLRRDPVHEEPGEVWFDIGTFTPGRMFDLLADVVRGIADDLLLVITGNGPTLRTSTLVTFRNIPG